MIRLFHIDPQYSSFGLDESIDSERDAREIVDLIFENLFGHMRRQGLMRTLINGLQNVIDSPTAITAITLEFSNIIEKTRKKNLYRQLLDIPKYYNAMISIQFSEERSAQYSGVLTTWSSGKHIVAVRGQRIAKTVYEMLGDDPRPSTQVLNKISTYLQDITSIPRTLVHELTHLWDEYVSDGKYIPQSYQVPTDDPGTKDLYLKQNIEVNARYVAAVQTLERMNMKHLSSFRDVRGVFGQNFQGWDVLSDDQQQRLLTRLYKWYTDEFRDKWEVNKTVHAFYNQQLFQWVAGVINKPRVSRMFTYKGSKVTPKIKDYVSQRGFIEYARKQVNTALKRPIPREYKVSKDVMSNPFLFLRSIAEVYRDIERFMKKNPNMNSPKLRDIVQLMIGDKVAALNVFKEEFDLTDQDLATIAENVGV